MSNNLATEAENILKNSQLALFADSEYGGDLSYSNALNFLQIIPRFDRRKISYSLMKDVENPVREYKTEYDNKLYTVRVTGASVARKNPKTNKVENVLVWPSNREEKVEAAILKIATNGGISEIKSKGYSGYGCYFSIYQIRDLTGMHPTDIKEAIDIMNKSNLEIESQSNAKETLSAPLLPVKYVSAQTGSRDDKCFVIFHPAVMVAINSLSYRPYLYEAAEQHKKSLTKYLHKRLIVRYTYADEGKPYHFSLRKIFNDFGKVPVDESLEIKKLRNLLRDMRISLQELRDCDIILPNFTSVSKRNDEGDICDYEITIQASPNFIKEQKKSNYIVKDRIIKYETIENKV